MGLRKLVKKVSRAVGAAEVKATKAVAKRVTHPRGTAKAMSKTVAKTVNKEVIAPVNKDVVAPAKEAIRLWKTVGKNVYQFKGVLDALKEAQKKRGRG